MDEVLRKRLSAEELDRYETYDRWASFASHLVVWPGIAAFLFFATGQGTYAFVFFLIAAVAFPVVVVMGRRAGALRFAAQERYAAIMGKAADDQPAPDRDGGNAGDKGA